MINANQLFTNSDPIDEAGIRRYRLNRVRQLLAQEDATAVLLFDPINIRYTNGSRNMQVWTMHNFARYALVVAGGPSIMFDLPTGYHLLAGLEDTIDEIRPAMERRLYGHRLSRW